MATKQFKVASISLTHNSFGLRGHVLVAADGEAWEVGRSIANPEPWAKGQTVNVPTWEGTGHLAWARMSVELPRRLADVPPEAAAELWPKPPRPVIELTHNGDPYGKGFVASESHNDGGSWYYRGDIGARSRTWWRGYCRTHGYRLREATGQYNLRAERNRATVPAG